MGDGHHILELITGKSAPYCSSVSATAPTATLADGLSTALHAMPLPQAEELLRNEPDVAARFTFANGLVRETRGWTNTPI